MEPSGSQFPAAYDDATTLLGAMANRRRFSLSAAVDNATTTLPITETLEGVEVPLYVLYGNEIVFAPEISGNSFVNCIRHVRSSATEAHALGDVGFSVLSGMQLNQFRDAIIAGQKFQGLVGADAAKPASPVVNQVYFATDTLRVYVCVSAGEWTWSAGRLDHAELNDLLHADAHTQYHNDARAQTWHDALSGDHVQGGDTHDHTYGGAGQVASGASKVATPTYVREVFLETGTGYLWVSKDASTWVRVSGAATGTIAPFLQADITTLYGGACPSGWSRFTALDGKFPRGALTGGATGGATTHQHTYTGTPAHTHLVAAYTASLASTGSHNHAIYKYNSQSGSGVHISTGRNVNSFSVSSAGQHSHDVTVPAHNTANPKRTSDDAAGVATGTATAASSLPPYQEVIWCVKD